MASLIEELITVMESEEKIYKELIPIAEKKTRIIIDNDLEALQDTTDQEQRVIEKINALERRREEVIVNIGTVISRNPSSLNMKALIKLMEKQPPEKRRLCEVHDSLKATVTRLAQINDRNKSLIQQSLEMIEFNMNLIQSTRMSPGNNNYTKSASQWGNPVTQTGMFDAKQ